MQQVTLCFLINKPNSKILLAMKKRGFGVGKINGVGGKVNGGEDIKSAAAREVEEEIGVKINPNQLIEAGSVKFFFNDAPDWNQHMHIFLAENWEGDPGESEEMKPDWHNFNEIPFEKMWIDDKHWLPLVLAGKKISGSFYFNNKGAEIDKFEILEA